MSAAFSLSAVTDCVRCANGHAFCRNCVGEWCAIARNQYTIPDFRRFSSVFRDNVCRGAVVSGNNTCPVCSVRGPFRPDQKTDDTSALQVSLVTKSFVQLLVSNIK